jgi:dTDP-4-dehydrorhamnose reductase
MRHELRRYPNSVLITGAAGLLGANLALQYRSSGLDVVATDLGRLPAIDGVQTVVCDLLEAGAAAKLIEERHPDCVIHCAALTNVDQCEADPGLALRVNAGISGNLAAVAARAGARFVYISTDSVFDGSRGGYTEADPVAPLNSYAKSKLAGERAVLEASPEALTLRTNIYGWNMQAKSSLAEWILARLESALETPGFLDVVFCPILVNDLADVILQAAGRGLSGCFHATGSEACSKYEFAVRIAEVFECDRALIRPASIDDSPLKAPRPKNTSLVVSRIEGALDRKMPGLDDGLQRFKALRQEGFVALLKHAGKGEAHVDV